ncbi:MAG: methyltransferase domain-containing protein [Chloroflexi bacterium]|nr:methyltransferase domain-containing protein [Chloroflexota bacterium]
MTEGQRYVFGDSTLGERRLSLLAQVFEPTSALFIRAAAPETVSYAIDLGCGPGHTTRMLADAFPTARVIGLDNSEQFILAARGNGHHRPQFILHDVTGDPPPGPPADLMYARCLLTHISDSAGAISRWIGFLNRSGRLLVEEKEDIETRNPVFAKYLEMVINMLAGQSNNLYLGLTVSRFAKSAGLNCTFDEVTLVRVKDRDAASMFRMNIETWQFNPFILENYSQRDMSSMMSALDDIRDAGGEHSSITFSLRQVAFERA